MLFLAFVLILNTAFSMHALAVQDYSTIRVKLSAGTNSGGEFSGEFTPNGNYYLLENPIVLLSGQKYTVKKENDTLSLYLGQERLVSSLSVLSVRQNPADAGNTNTVTVYNNLYKQNIHYLGDMIFKLVDGTGYVINSLYLEKYLYGVLPYEMNDNFPLEALKAQAIAARSYAVDHMGSGSYDLDDTSNRQVYRGYNASNDRCILAVNETEKQVLQYNGEVIEAYFCASNGGMTELPTHVWPNNPVSINGPYQNAADEFDKKNPYSEWERIYFPLAITASDGIAYTKRSGGGSTAPVAATAAQSYLKLLAFNSFSDADKATYGLASPDAIVLKGVTAMTANTPVSGHTDACADYTLASATVLVQLSDTLDVSKDIVIDMRELNGTPSIYGSIYETFTTSRRLLSVEPVSQSGSVVGFAMYNRGFGGGLGLSQRGAEQRANKGQGFAAILGFYYPNCPQVDGHYPQLAIAEPVVTLQTIPQYTVSTVPNNAAYGTTNGQSAVGGNIVTVTATPKPFYAFLQWKDGSTVVSTDPSYSFHISGNRTLTAEFASTFRAVTSSFNSIQLGWDSVANVSGYEIYRATAQAGPYTLLGATASTSYLNSGLTAGKTYYYKARAYKSSGSAKTYTEYSSVISAVPVPSSPASLSAAPVSYNSIRLSWASVAGKSGYRVYRATTPNGTYTLVATTSSNRYTNTRLNVGTTYYYKVQAYRKVGRTKVYGGFSDVVSAVTSMGTPVSVKASSSAYNSIKISWKSVTGRSGYEVYRAESQAGPYARVGSTSSTSYTNSGLNVGTTYYYQVRAYRLVGGTRVYGSFSVSVSATPKLLTPTSVRASRANATSIKLKWGSVSGANGYDLYRSVSKTGTYELVTSTSSRSYTDTGLLTGTRYYYKVVAYRMVGTAKVFGGFSVIVNARP